MIESLQELALSLNDAHGLQVIISVCAGVLVFCALLFCLCGKKDRLGSLLQAVGFIEVSAVFIFLTSGIEEMAGMDSSSKLVPYLWSIPLFFVSLVQLVRVWRASASAKKSGAGRYDKVLLTFLIAALAIWQLKTLGFFVSTAAMLILMMLLFGERRIVLILGTAILWVAFTWIVFNKVLLLSLPTGTLFASLLG